MRPLLVRLRVETVRERYYHSVDFEASVGDHYDCPSPLRTGYGRAPTAREAVQIAAARYRAALADAQKGRER